MALYDLIVIGSDDGMKQLYESFITYHQLEINKETYKSLESNSNTFNQETHFKKLCFIQAISRRMEWIYHLLGAVLTSLQVCGWSNTCQLALEAVMLCRNLFQLFWHEAVN